MDSKPFIGYLAGWQRLPLALCPLPPFLSSPGALPGVASCF